MFEWLLKLDQHFPVRHTAWLLSAVGLLLSTYTWVAFGLNGWWALVFLFLTPLLSQPDRACAPITHGTASLRRRQGLDCT
jgi:hypothetical protein